MHLFVPFEFQRIPPHFFRNLLRCFTSLFNLACIFLFVWIHERIRTDNSFALPVSAAAQKDSPENDTLPTTAQARCTTRVLHWVSTLAYTWVATKSALLLIFTLHVAEPYGSRCIRAATTSFDWISPFGLGFKFFWLLSGAVVLFDKRSCSVDDSINGVVPLEYPAVPPILFDNSTLRRSRICWLVSLTIHLAGIVMLFGFVALGTKPPELARCRPGASRCTTADASGGHIQHQQTGQPRRLTQGHIPVAVTRIDVSTFPRCRYSTVFEQLQRNKTIQQSFAITPPQTPIICRFLLSSRTSQCDSRPDTKEQSNLAPTRLEESQTAGGIQYDHPTSISSSLSRIASPFLISRCPSACAKATKKPALESKNMESRSNACMFSVSQRITHPRHPHSNEANRTTQFSAQQQEDPVCSLRNRSSSLRHSLLPYACSSTPPSSPFISFPSAPSIQQHHRDVSHAELHSIRSVASDPYLCAETTSILARGTDCYSSLSQPPSSRHRRRQYSHPGACCNTHHCHFRTQGVFQHSSAEQPCTDQSRSIGNDIQAAASQLPAEEQDYTYVRQFPVRYIAVALCFDVISTLTDLPTVAAYCCDLQSHKQAELECANNILYRISWLTWRHCLQKFSSALKHLNASILNCAAGTRATARSSWRRITSRCLALFSEKKTHVDVPQHQNLHSHVRLQAFLKDTSTEEPQCCICCADYMPADDVTLLPCPSRHYFHSQCAEAWLRQHATCPLCRHTLLPSAVLPA